ncbi:CRISPR-associated helicase Cas3' [Actinosynnema sp. NPDC023587]|uniref:CRISPR-associated helicase Cas3' n=1 Tax=Actinosynnema sp. NPDC023587 TaxID=3154695 RepID=UPI0034068192
MSWFCRWWSLWSRRSSGRRRGRCSSVLLAHSPGRVPGAWHSLADHVRSTAELARRFAESFDAGPLAWALGLVHDAGKADCGWQSRLLKVAMTRGKVGGDHKSLGALVLGDRALDAAMAVLGHHGGLTSPGELEKLTWTPDLQTAWARFVAEVPEARGLEAGPSLVPVSWFESEFVADIGIRLVFSALVDADHLDTAAHHHMYAEPRVRPPVDMAGLLRRFEAGRAVMLEKPDEPSELDVVRTRLYDDAVRLAKGEPGVFRLPAPTGSGKTLTAAGAALHHAAVHGKSRVIVAVPFTTITGQNAEVYRRVLGTDVVLEHHSNAELDDYRLRLSAENWDAPFVVTTTVQLFDSLFGRKPSRSRKLHRLANAVVVLDEVQALPISLLVPILDALRTLVKHFRTTVILASATQPTFEHLKAWEDLKVVPLVEAPVEIFSKLKRVRYEWQLDPRPTWEQIASQISGEGRALAIVNTVGHARELHRMVRDRRPDATVLHLSTRMCPAHRKVELDRIHRLLKEKNGEPVLVVSTQLVEAGVDLDFPVVFRALAPSEALQQAAGRANREGKIPGLGRVVVFDPDGTKTPAFYQSAVDKTRAFFGPGRDPDDPVLLDAYYRSLYTGLNVDEARRGSVIQFNRSERDFEAVAYGPENDGKRDGKLAFRMIDEDPVTVIATRYESDENIADLVDQVRVGDKQAGRILRELRRYMVPLPRRIATAPEVRALCRPVLAGDGDLWEWVGPYDPSVGIDEQGNEVETVW